MKLRKLLPAVGILTALGLGTAFAAGVFTNGLPVAGSSSFPTTIPLTGLETVPVDTNLASGQNPASEAITLQQIGGFANAVANSAGFRNALINGTFDLYQRGNTSGDISNTLTYQADRWWNLGGASSAINVGKQTAAADITAGFVASNRFQRKSANADLTKICTGQALESVTSARFQGQKVEFTFWALAGANFSAASSQIQVTIQTGTGSDQSAATQAAGTWTGAANGVQALTAVSTTWTRYSATATIPVTATQVGVQLCFTPVGTAGANDWVEFTGVQLAVNPNAVSGVVGLASAAQPLSFEHRPLVAELVMAQRYTFVVNELAAGVVQSSVGTAQGTTTTCTTFIPFPVQMRVAPTYANALTVSTFKLVSASQAATALSTPFSATLVANSVNGASLNFTTTGMTAKDSCFLVGAAGTGTMTFASEL